MKFTLILATLNRYDELIPLLNSLKNQTYKNFELIIIDQNNNDKIKLLTNSYKFNMKIIKSKTKGLSYNRNIGLDHAGSDIIAFPDDDCEYESSTLEKVNNFFLNQPEYNFYTSNTREKKSNLSVTSSLPYDANINIYNVMRTGISFTIFVRSGALNSFKFDEKLGIGADFGSGEETDLLLFLLKNKKRGFYSANDYIYHPAKAGIDNRAFQYGKGFGAVFKKAIVKYHFTALFFIYLLYLIKTIIKLIFYRDKNQYLLTLKGRISGFLQYKN